MKNYKLLILSLLFMGVVLKNPAPDLFSNLFGPSPDIKDVIYKIINLLLSFAFAIAILFLIIGGYQFMTSGANPSLAEQGKKTLTNAIIGIVIIVLSYTVISVIYKTLL
jgi:amino acid transporter